MEAVSEALDASGISRVPQSSPKIRQLLALLHDIKTDSNEKEKTIIFSHFTMMLDVVQRFLAAEGIVFTRCECSVAYKAHLVLTITRIDDGSMSSADRERSLDIIRNSETTQCILMSVSAGGLG